jgi:hypothetical protein
MEGFRVTVEYLDIRGHHGEHEERGPEHFDDVHLQFLLLSRTGNEQILKLDEYSFLKEA